MWLLENEADALKGRRLWLRPGKLYLFGRTSENIEPGTLAIAHKTISRKHLTIQVDTVPDGGSQDLSTRSTVTIEDLNTKTGTTVDGHKYKGEKHVVTEAAAEIKVGGCPQLFRLTWHPVVLTFSSSSKELQADPFARLRPDLEQLDVKLIPEYNIQHTTHVVVKKRNTSKGLQALINGKYIVTDSFVNEFVVAAAADPTDTSALENDFDGHWPDALKYLPPRGGEPVEHPSSVYEPDESRHNVFEGYTFIFYDKGQFDNLRAPIANGKGKALYTKVDPNVTTVDEFILHVKTVAGEKGLGSFEDGSEGRGVVVVRYTPSKHVSESWYADFFTQVSIRLDHRPIEQNEFLEAILIKDASILRRPLEFDPTQGPRSSPPRPQASTDSMEIDQPAASQNTPQESAPSGLSLRTTRVRRAATRRFAGFDADDDNDEEAATPAVTERIPVDAEPEEGLFVSQDAGPPDEIPESSPEATTRRSQRKRPAPQDDNLVDDMIPTAAAAKRRRVAAGEDPIPRQKEPEPEKAPEPKAPAKTKKAKKEIDVLDVARQRREEMEARAKAEKEDLANLPDDIDLSEIRRLHIVEEMPLRQPSTDRNHEQDAENGRWDPRWNGRKNFKRFRARGELTGRQPQKVIVSLVEVKKKDFGIGDDHWLEEDSQRKKKGSDGQKSGTNRSEPVAPAPPAPSRQQRIVLSDDSEEESAMPDAEPAPESTPAPAPAPAPRGRASRAATTQSQATSQSQTQRSTRGKRAAPPPVSEPPAKKTRSTRKAVEVADSDDDSDDELQFRFGRRR
ncbi:FHA domain-containing protein [Colletotrichum karsti]|uniref:FHA domain-containing protein n=1 Tax=Colletotrichum karsti TaxID=1095194 RepID=A0A9P6LI26_9PEZI|nr:FHA domain-containing protein [Colletotrichum karsti]KAF9876899.1 FHA domain-containing protein [Colletotrichum karsti]